MLRQRARGNSQSSLAQRHDPTRPEGSRKSQTAHSPTTNDENVKPFDGSGLPTAEASALEPWSLSGQERADLQPKVIKFYFCLAKEIIDIHRVTLLQMRPTAKQERFRRVGRSGRRSLDNFPSRALYQ